jgi:hypothetical protein
MKAVLFAGMALAVLLGGAIEANAQVYELIKTCKRSWRTALVCIVIEKGAEKAVERSVEDWLADWRSGKGQKAPDTALRPAAPGVDYRQLMRDLDARVGKAPLKEQALVDRLGRSCLGAQTIACTEFRPLFSAARPSSCATILTSMRCNMSPDCTWHGAPSSTRNPLPGGHCAPKLP